jgi:hypothetical protein
MAVSGFEHRPSGNTRIFASSQCMRHGLPFFFGHFRYFDLKTKESTSNKGFGFQRSFMMGIGR